MDLTAKAKEEKSTGKKRPRETRTYFNWFADNGDPSADDIAEVIKDDMWPNPLQYFLVPDIELENGGEEEELEEEEEEVDDNVVVTEEEEEGEEEEDGEEEGDDK